MSTSHFCSLQVHRNSTLPSPTTRKLFISSQSLKKTFFFFFFPFLHLSLIFSHQPNNAQQSKIRVSITPTDQTKTGKMSTTSLQINPESPPLSLQPVLIPANADGHDGSPGCHGVWFDVVLVVASVVFIGYLSIHAKKNLKKLYNRGSYILISYYALLWFATLLNLTWSSLQVPYLLSF